MWSDLIYYVWMCWIDRLFYVPVWYLTLYGCLFFCLLPDDYNRVHLATGNREAGCDYINASFIDVWKTATSCYVFFCLCCSVKFNYTNKCLKLRFRLLRAALGQCLCMSIIRFLVLKGFKESKKYIAAQGIVQVYITAHLPYVSALCLRVQYKCPVCCRAEGWDREWLLEDDLGAAVFYHCHGNALWRRKQGGHELFLSSSFVVSELLVE